MADQNNPSPALSQDSQAEQQMRKALGLVGAKPSSTPQQRPEQARQRHRFAQDGSVPVVMLNSHSDPAGLKDRITTLQSRLDAEQAAHAMTKRALQEQQAANQALQTQSMHAKLAQTEAIAAERNGRKQAEDALAELRAVLAERDAAPPAPIPAPPAEPPAPKAVRKPRVSTAAATREPKPVRWWVPSYKAKTKA